MGAMTLRHAAIAALYINVAAFSATAETSVIRPDTCVAGAVPKVIRLTPEAGRPDDQIVVYLAPPQKGWASARLLARYRVQGGPRPPLMRGCARD
jgi:hypothetical protein